MNQNLQRTKRAGGFAMMLVMGAVAVVFVIGMVLLSGMPGESRVSRNLIDRERAVYLAESGLAEALNRLQNPPNEGETWSGVSGRAVGDDGGNYDVLVTDMGDDIYKITSTGRVPAANGIEAAQQIEMMVQLTADQQINFDITDSTVTVNQPFAAKTGVAGAEISSGGDPMPVTVRIRIGDTVFDPYGNYNSPTAANVNKNGDFEFIVPDTGNAGDEVSVEATSWEKKRSYYSGNNDSHWESYLSVSTADDSPLVKALRDGDSVPEIDPLSGQSSVGDIVRPYIDATTGRITLDKNQVIYLFELGTTNIHSSAADFQDLVLVVTFASSTDQLQNQSTTTQSTSGGSKSLGLLGYSRKTVTTTNGGATILGGGN